ncbi:NADH-quinone oxidoreductase subunit H [Arcicella rosea]|uniref:complex I subunit 1/NuoH family protein n=1 Tax=Arcicella rosea TaxID=502909 RepID=UPI00345C7576
MFIALLICLGLVLTNVVVGVYAERKVSAFMQDRLGPMEVGKYGLLQVLADLIKLLQKEDIVPALANKRLFLIAPCIIFVAIFAGFAVLPLGPSEYLQGSQAEVGLFYLLAVISIDIIGILMAGWASNNKYSLFGAMRSVAQIVSYEVPLGLTVICVAMISQSLNLQEISLQQGIYTEETNYLFGLKFLDIDVSKVGGFLTWNIVRVPFFFPIYIIFFIATLAECNRAPFDLPEAESELVGGFHTEYSGMRWALVFLSEYGMMLLVSILGAILFLGSWNTPFPNIGFLKLADWTSGEPNTWSGAIWGFFWLIAKSYAGVFVQMWIRWTFPRLRVDQLMYLTWKVLTPFAILGIFLSAIWRLLM